MHRIFSRASKVLIWLGPAYDDSELAVETLRQTGKIEINLRSFNAVQSLLNREYWWRLWIVQEFLLANRRLFLCGDKTFYLEDIRNIFSPPFAPMNHGIGQLEESLHKRAHGWTIVLHAKFQGSSPHLFELPRLLEQYGEQHCQDKQDKIYALYGLVEPRSPTNLEALKPDYSKSVKQLFTDVLLSAQLSKMCVLSYKGFIEKLESALEVSSQHPIVRTALQEARDWVKDKDSLALVCDIANVNS
jgi:Heterokaryon incompatibility protein (HET)